MKTQICCLLFLLSACAAFAQSPVPESVKSDFAKRFPTATGVRWEREGKQIEGEFKENGKGVSGVYDQHGKWLMTERAISLAELPKAVQDGIQKLMPTAKVKGAESMQLANGSTQYEVKVADQGKFKEAVFDSKGALVKHIVEKGEMGSGTDGSAAGSGSADEDKAKH